MIEYVILFIIVIIAITATFCMIKGLDSWDKIKAYVSGTTVTTTTSTATTATTATATGTTATTTVTTTTATVTKTTTASTNPSISGTTTTVIEPHPTINNPTPTTTIIGQSEKSSNTFPVSNTPPATSIQPVIQAPPKPLINTLYMIDPGDKYINGKTYDEANAACLANGDRMATILELQKARMAGFEKCVNGWTEEKQAVFAMQKTDQPGCLTNVNGLSINNFPSTNKYGAYCMTTKAVPSGISLYQII